MLKLHLSAVDVSGKRILFGSERELSATDTRQSRYVLRLLLIYTVFFLTRVVERLTLARKR